MPTEPLLLIGTLVGLAGFFGTVWYFSADNVTRRLLKASPITPLLKTCDGMQVRVTGRARPREEGLQAPLSGRRCVWYGVYVDEFRNSGRSGRWVEVIREERGVDFYLDDRTAVAVVRCLHPRVASPRDISSSSGLFDDATEVERALLKKYGRDDVNMLGMNRRLRYREAAFEPGEIVTVLGTVHPYEDRVARYEIVPPSQGTLLMSDDPSTIR